MRHILYLLSIGAGLRAMLTGMAMALLLSGAPIAHADAFGSGNKAAPSAELEARLKALEQTLQTLNSKLSQLAGGASQTSSDTAVPEIPAQEFVYEPTYEVGGTVNGYIIVRSNGKMQMLTTREFIVFRSRDKALAYKQFLLEQSGMLSAIETSATASANGNGGGNNGNGNGNGGGNNGNGNGPGGGNNGNGGGNSGGNGTGNGNGPGGGNNGNGGGNGGGVMPPPPPPPTPTDNGQAQALAKKK